MSPHALTFATFLHGGAVIAFAIAIGVSGESRVVLAIGITVVTSAVWAAFAWRAHVKYA
jgi:hypothetical protein